MGEYDFSKIKTEELRCMMKKCDIYNDTHCYSIECLDCPFNSSKDENECTGDSEERQYKLFKEELNRREKMENKMPELKAGMIVDIESESGITRCVLLETDKGLQPIANNWNWQCNISECKILRIYKVESSNYNIVFNRDDYVTLLWAKKSDKDIKIEELEKTINEAQRQIKELKEQ